MKIFKVSQKKLRCASCAVGLGKVHSIFMFVVAPDFAVQSTVELTDTQKARLVLGLMKLDKIDKTSTKVQHEKIY